MEAAYSPIKTKRREEKANLQVLNGRLENYTLKVGQLKEQNDTLQFELEHARSRMMKEMNTMKARYEKEIESLRKELEDETEQRARFQVLEQDQHQELDILRPLAEEAKELRLRVETLETHLHSALESKRIVQENFEASKLEAQALQRRVSILEKECKTSSHALQTLQEENEKLCNENAELCGGSDKRISQLQREHATKLEALQVQYKNELDERIAKSTAEIRNHWEAMVQQNEARIEELNKETESLRSELISSQAGYENSSKMLAESREVIRQVEMQLRVEQRKRKEERQVLEKDLEKAQEARRLKENEFNELMDVKIALDAEISAYNSILEREESRVGISTPKKRRRTSSRQSSAKKRRAHQIYLKTLDLVKGCIVIENKSDKELPLKGWIVKSATELHAFSFPDNYVLQAKSTVSVWSGKKNKAKMDLPSDLFWTKKFSWNPEGDAAILLNPEGLVVSYIAERMEFPQDVLDKLKLQEIEQENEEKSTCTIM